MAIRWDEIEGANFGPYLYSIADEAERLEVLFRECYDEIRSLCRSVLRRTGNISDADDATQEALIRAALAVRRSYKPEMPFRPWLRTVAYNVCADFGRAQSRSDKGTDRCIELGFGLDVCTPAPDGESPEHAVMQRFEIDAVIQAMRALSPLEREALYLQFYRGMSYEEISEVAGQTHSSVRSCIHRAKVKVKRHLRAVGGFDDWGLAGVAGAAATAMRRWRARSRAWVLRNTGAVGDGATSSVALGRAAEVVATAAVAMGMLFFPADGFSSTPSPAAAGAAADTVDVHSASFRAVSDGSDGQAGDIAATSPPAEENMRSTSTDAPGVVALPAAILPPGPEREGDGYERSEDGKYARSPLRVEQDAPVVGEVRVGDGDGVGFECDYSKVREAACDTLDHLPDF